MKGINWKEFLHLDKSQREIQRWADRMKDFEEMIQNRLKISKNDRKQCEDFTREANEIFNVEQIDQQAISKFSENIIYKYFDEKKVGTKDLHIIREFITKRITHIERDGFEDKLKQLTHKKWLQVKKAREHLEKIYVYVSNRLNSKFILTVILRVLNGSKF